MAALFEVKQIILNLMASFPDWKPPNQEKTIEQYAVALQGFKVDTIEHAANVCRDTCLFFPKIAELKKAISESYQADTQKSYEDNKRDEFKKAEYTPELAKYIDDFRQHMIEKGRWRIHSKSKEAMRGLV